MERVANEDFDAGEWGRTTTADDNLIACVDVDYRPSVAVAAGLWFREWSATTPEYQVVASFTGVAEYEPGAFYRRELPCLLEVLDRGPRPNVIVVDGYVWLGNGTPGLGGRLHAAVGGIVVGVAKTQYRSAPAVPVLRGLSRSPLFITAAGVESEVAAGWIERMHGPYRVPTLLRQVDALARSTKDTEAKSL